MRIAFVGKGGSGKTTLSSLFIKHLVSLGKPVLAIDADINQHLGPALGIPESELEVIPTLSQDMRMVKEWLRGKNRRITSADAMIRTTPPGEGSRLLRFNERSPILSIFGRRVDGATLLRAGEFSEEDVGLSCYHAKTGAAELLLNHLADGPNEYVVVDMTAGADSFSSGLFLAFDLTILVAEPTLKSVGVRDQYVACAAGYEGVDVRVVGNKLADDEDHTFLKERIGDAVLGNLTHSAYIKALDRGEQRPIAQLEPENLAVLDAIKTALDAKQKDWKGYYERANEFHRKKAELNQDYAYTLIAQIDEGFPAACAARVF